MSVVAQPPQETGNEVNDADEDGPDKRPGPWFASWLIRLLKVAPPVLFAVAEVIYMLRH